MPVLSEKYILIYKPPCGTWYVHSHKLYDSPEDLVIAAKKFLSPGTPVSGLAVSLTQCEKLQKIVPEESKCRCGGIWRSMVTAPRDGSEFWALSDDTRGNDLPPFVSKCSWHPDAGFCTDELREPIMWRPL